MRDLFSPPDDPGPSKLAAKTPSAGGKILLVEDNPVNLKLAVAILELLGYATVTADSGEKALERLRCENGIDLVLMDCQMPGMDGFEATRVIRTMQAEGEIPPMPVIALTAFAMKGDRERCLEAGMDDYLTKPLRKDVLGNLLVKWLAKEKSAAVADEDHKATPDDIELVDTPCLDPVMLDHVRTLMGGKFENAVQLYFEDTDDRIRAIERMVAASGDTKNIALQAHSIKSSSAHMGAAHLAVLAGNMEMSAQDAADHCRDTTNLTPLLEEIRKIFAETQLNFRAVV